MQVKVTACKVSHFEFKQEKANWEMVRKAYNIPLFVNLGIYEGLEKIKNYCIPQGSQNINSIAQGISNSN